MECNVTEPDRAHALRRAARTAATRTAATTRWSEGRLLITRGGHTTTDTTDTTDTPPTLPTLPTPPDRGARCLVLLARTVTLHYIALHYTRRVWSSSRGPLHYITLHYITRVVSGPPRADRVHRTHRHDVGTETDSHWNDTDDGRNQRPHIAAI